MPSVLIIIVTYNGSSHIRQCLTSFDSGNPDVACMIIDNGSSDDTVDIIKKEYPEVMLVETGKNLGFGAANNIGLRYALDNGYDYVYLLNQDAWIEPEDILKLIDIAERNPGYGIISPLQVYAGKKKIDQNFSSKVTQEMMDDYLLPGNIPKELYRIQRRTIQAAHWLVPVMALKKVGGFSPTFFHYGEDDNLCQRMEFHGFKLGVVPQILAVHNRETREKTVYYNLLMSTNKWKKTISDPNLTPKVAFRLLLVNMCGTLLSFPRNFIPHLFLFLKELSNIIKNRSDSINLTAPFIMKE